MPPFGINSDSWLNGFKICHVSLPDDTVDTHEGYALDQSFHFGENGLWEKLIPTRIYVSKKKNYVPG